MDAFWSQWLSGLSDGVRALEPSARDTLLHACGRACAAPEVLPRMRNLFLKSENTSNFFHAIDKHMPGVHVSEVSPGLIYEFVYDECGCPLYTEQGLRDGFLCECSRHSLSWIMGELYPESQPQVTLLEGILRGARQCRLRVAFPYPQAANISRNASPRSGYPDNEAPSTAQRKLE